MEFASYVTCVTIPKSNPETEMCIMREDQSALLKQSSCQNSGSVSIDEIPSSLDSDTVKLTCNALSGIIATYSESGTTIRRGAAAIRCPCEGAPFL